MIINRSILSHGYSNFTLKVLEFCDSALLLKRENYYFKLIVPEYNIAKDATSPMLGKKHSEEAKAKMSAFKKGNIHLEETKAKSSAGNKGKTYSNETIHKISVSKKGENHPMFGKTHSEETLIKLAKVKIGKKHSAETIAKISNSKKGGVRPEGAGRIEKKKYLSWIFLQI
jgi:group I intron endonuclease